LLENSILKSPRLQHIDALIAHASTSLATSLFRQLTLSKPIANPVQLSPSKTGENADALSGAERIMLRPSIIKGVLHLSLLYRFATKDITKNFLPEQALQIARALLEVEFANAHLVTETADLQLITSGKGKAELRRAKNSNETAPGIDNAGPGVVPQHDRKKIRALDLNVPFLAALGISQRAAGGSVVLVPAMAAKFRQINKFLEIFASAIAKSILYDQLQLTVMDFGAGKGYLTFALDHYLRATLATKPGHTHLVLGIELREELVAAGNAICAQLGNQTLKFIAGDVRTHPPTKLDVMVALHACDTATDHAIHFGIRQRATVILCSPCCHKQLRPQIKLPGVLAPLLQHGVHLGQEAEMLTDGLRALLLEAAGYQTQVFEFIATEHTAKNKMILAVRRQLPLPPARAAELIQQIAALKAFYGVQEHCLESLLAD
jgi:hypothetical protein